MHRLRVSGPRLRLRVVTAITAALAAAVFVAAAPTSSAASLSSGAARGGSGGVAPESGGAEVRDRGAAFKAENWPRSAVRSISPEVLQLALGATQCALRAGAAKNASTLTIIDYSKPSVEPRLWVLDLTTRALLYEELVSHGQGSGGNLATRFSNTPDSHQTSLGLFVTDTTYVGRNGYSLRLDGLEAGFNDRARERAIVMHGAPYVNERVTKTNGRLGRSHGCPAVRDMIARELIDRVKGGSLVFAYYPDADWLKTSRYLGQCSN